MEELANEELIAPVQFFVALSVYADLVKTPAESDIEYRKFHGETIAGAS